MLVRVDESEIDYGDALVTLQGWQKRQAESANLRTGRGRMVVVWVLVIGLACLLAGFLIREDGRRGARRPKEDPTWAIPVVGCVGSFIGSLAAAAWLGRRAPSRGSGKRDPQPIEITVDESGAISDGTHNRVTYRWSLFCRFAETAKSFVLDGKRVNAASFLMLVIPKTAFAGQDGLSICRQILAANVLPEASRSTRADAAFPVVLRNPPGGENADAGLCSKVGDVSTGCALLESVQYAYEDFAVNSVGWRRSSGWSGSFWAIASLTMLGVGIIVSSVVAVAGAIRWPAMWLMLALPGCAVWGIGKSLLAPRRSHAGARGEWGKHVLSHGPASVVLRDDGIVLRSVHHEMLLKTGSVIAVMESDDAFSVMDRQWEVIVPKRMLAPEAVVRVGEALRAQFGQTTVVPKGKVICVRPEDGDGPRAKGEIG